MKLLILVFVTFNATDLRILDDVKNKNIEYVVQMHRNNLLTLCETY